jgi:hypothetical protein
MSPSEISESIVEAGNLDSDLIYMVSVQESYGFYLYYCVC